MRVRVHPLIASTWAELTSLAQDYIELAGVEVGTRTSPQEGVEVLTLSNYSPTTSYFSSLKPETHSLSAPIFSDKTWQNFSLPGY